MIDIEIRKFKDVDLKDGTVLEGFPGVGLVSTIAATYLIDLLKLDQVCAMESEGFPPTSMIYATRPKFPARIYASAEHKLAVFLAEFTPTPELHRPIARRLLEWTEEQKCRRIVSSEGLPKETECDHQEGVERKVKVFGIGSTDRARKELEDLGIPQLETGIIYGVSGILLNEGRWRNFDVIALMAEACPHVPDALAAARVIEYLDLLMPSIEIDTKPLYEQSKKFESQLKGMRKQAEPKLPDAFKTMYG